MIFFGTESISGHSHDFVSSTSISNDHVALFQCKVRETLRKITSVTSSNCESY